jgi:hypothetical protein
MRRISGGLIVTALVMASALAGTGAGSKASAPSKQAQPACKRCSPAFPGSIPHCGAGGSGSGGTTSGGGGRPGGGG